MAPAEIESSTETAEEIANAEAQFASYVAL
jgi:hypothetical protein